MSTTTFYLPEPLLNYVHAKGVREDAALRALREETSTLDMAIMQISPEQGQFLKVLTTMIGARRCIEVGVFTGYSTLCVAQAIGADGYVLACDVSEEWTAIGRRHWEQAGVAERIDLKLAPALETLDARIADGEAGQYDFAFIDANKEDYSNYYERCLTLLRAGGVVAIDNVLWSGNVANDDHQDDETRAIRAVNDLVAADDRVTACMIPISDGLTVAVKR